MINKDTFKQLMQASLDYYKKLEFLMDNGYGMSVEHNVFITYFDKVISATLDTFSDDEKQLETIYDLFYKYAFRSISDDEYLLMIGDIQYNPTNLDELYDMFVDYVKNFEE